MTVTRQNRREFLTAIGSTAIAMALSGHEPIGEPMNEQYSRQPGGKTPESCADMRGFNCNPSYCTTLYEMWDRFDRNVWTREIKRGKRYFPKLNCLRIWLDVNPYLRDRKRFVSNLDWAADLCDSLGIRLMPTLFNRWHDYTYDFAGIYIDQFFDRAFDRFLDYICDVVTPLRDDKRIWMWDLCNEPQAWDPKNPVHQAEIEWFRWTATRLRGIGTVQPITVGAMTGEYVAAVELLCDVLCFHPYPGWWDEGYAAECNRALNLARSKNKPLIANETCQGSLSDEVRERIIRGSLGALRDRGIGWCAWQLHGGRMISANPGITDTNAQPGDRGYIAFIDPQGRLRPHHEAYNDY
ncbi:MAG: hypothetical protein IT210_10630 [Armatimonadetes bacterium]|nr:hypothetical protein [Armatimonadota bacterium]